MSLFLQMNVVMTVSTFEKVTNSILLVQLKISYLEYMLFKEYYLNTESSALIHEYALC